MKSSKAQIDTKFHKISAINFEERQITSFFCWDLDFPGTVQTTVSEKQIEKCFYHLKLSPIFGHHIIALLLIVHLNLGFHSLVFRVQR